MCRVASLFQIWDISCYYLVIGPLSSVPLSPSGTPTMHVMGLRDPTFSLMISISWYFSTNSYLKNYLLFQICHWINSFLLIESLVCAILESPYMLWFFCSCLSYLLSLLTTLFCQEVFYLYWLLTFLLQDPLDQLLFCYRCHWFIGVHVWCSPSLLPGKTQPTPSADSWPIMGWNTWHIYTKLILIILLPVGAEREGHRPLQAQLFSRAFASP